MHFYYLDESGDTGANLNDADQPVMVLGGVSVRDEGWNSTQQQMAGIIDTYFGGAVPDDFELHAIELLSPAGNGPFAGHPMADRCGLCLQILDLLESRSHGVHYLAVDKARMQAVNLGLAVEFNPKRPYLLAFDYLVTYINWHLKERLGQTARGMIILDQKEQFHQAIEKIMRLRRFGGPAAHRVKWVVEFSYPVDSQKNPMVQLSDLIVYCTKRFVEIEHGYRPNWNQVVKDFYASCYSRIRSRVVRAQLVERNGRHMDRLNAYVGEVRLEPRVQWRRHYTVA